MRTQEGLDFVRFAGNARDMAIVMDGRGTILAASNSTKGLTGYTEDRIIGCNVVEFLHPEDVAEALRLLVIAQESPNTTASIDARVHHADGHWVPFEFLPLNLLVSDGFVILTGRDITERREIERARRDEEIRFRAIAQSAPIAIFRLDTIGRCEFVNDRWTELAGQSHNDALGTGWIDVIDRRDQLKLVEIRDGSDISGELDLRLHGRGSSQRSVIGRWTALFDERNERVGYVGTMEDVTERNALEARLLHQATHDSLTGLPNRLILNEHLTQFLAATSRSENRIGVVFCDLDQFKVVNDSLGHETGDRLLVAVARRMTANLRNYDVVGRFGGDEFVILTTLKHEDEIRELTNRLESLFTDPFDIGTGRPYKCTASIGIAVSDAHSTPETLLRDADVAMYRAKENGRGRSEQFDEHLRERALDRLMLLSDLPLAIPNGELRAFYQPIVHTRDGSLASVEALMRWEHPTRGLLPPDMFIELAEETGLILAFGDWILDRACTDLLLADPIVLNVNLSARQVHDRGLVERVAASLRRTGFPPGRLVLEITESVLVTDIESTITTLTRLKSLGVSIAVDDFGTGYSSLNYLSRFPVDSLKIDRTFVQTLGMPFAHLPEKNSTDNEIVRSVIALAHALGMSATAEGVETDTQLSQLATLNCDLCQGFLFQEPVSIDTLRSVWSDSNF
jgi:diguanylate cyclase (GGDEF)-like protein/PAS domain S-box-containing protein